MREANLVFFSSLRRTYRFRECARGCSIDVAVGKDQTVALPSMRTAHAHVVSSTFGNLPPCGQVWIQVGIVQLTKHSAIMDSVTMKGHVDIGAVALRGVGEGCVGAADAADAAAAAAAAAEGGGGAVGQDGSDSRNYIIVAVGVLVVDVIVVMEG
jgi:hypothetical protein